MDKFWHIFVDCLIMDPRHCNVVLLNAMNDVNWWVWLSLLLFVSLVFHFSLFYLLGPWSMTMSRTTSLPNCFAFGPLEIWSLNISKTSFWLPTKKYARLRWIRIILDIPSHWTSSSNFCTKFLSNLSSMLFVSFDALPLYSYLHCLERYIECRQ